ncbi:MAG: hypothetical protein JF586_08265 [Burkholderiales bacterium]|nr:hypothetical protein [Burkholderiales bacterium]
MNAANTSPLKAQRSPDMSIAWEAPPSLQHLVVRSDSAADKPTWAETMPVSLDAMNAPLEFREPLEGLSVRDIDEPEIFNVFFGDSSRSLRRAA